MLVQHVAINGGVFLGSSDGNEKGAKTEARGKEKDQAIEQCAMNTSHRGTLAGVRYKDARHIESPASPNQGVGSVLLLKQGTEATPVPIPCPSPPMASDSHTICLTYHLRIVGCLQTYIYNINCI